MPRIVFFNRVYWPSTEATAQLLRDLTLALSESGTEVMVVTGTPLEPSMEDNIPRLKVLRLGNQSGRHLNIFAKLRYYSQFAKSAQAVVAKYIEPSDTVVAMTDPPMIGTKIGPAVRNKRAKMWHWTQDVYPEAALAIKPFGPFTPLLRLLLGRRNQEWHEATGIVAIGEDMASKIKQSGVTPRKVRVSPNWAPANLIFGNPEKQRLRWGISTQSFVLAYSGNLGRAHVLDPVLDLAHQLQPYPSIESVIIGNGAQKAGLLHRARQQNLKRCTFLGPVSRSELGDSLVAADIHLITMRPDCLGTVWPSKFYGIVASSRPIIFIGPPAAEIAHLIASRGLGIAVTPDDLTPARDFVLRLQKNRLLHQAYCSRVEAFQSEMPGIPGATALWNGIVT